MSAEQQGGIQPIGYIPMAGAEIRVGGDEIVFSPAQTRPAEEGTNEGKPPAAPPPAAPTPKAPPAAQLGSSVRVGQGTYVSPLASVLGDVVLGQEVFVAPGASIRGDTGAQIRIGDGSNVQDGVVIHAMEGRSLVVGGKPYAVYVGDHVSLAHQAFLHGPVAIGDGTFVGFRAMVVNCKIGRGCVIWHGAFVSDVEIPDARLVPAGAIVDTPERARSLAPVSAHLREFAAQVIRLNRRYAQEYRRERR